MRILIINGPNLNMTGTREPALYGTRSFDDYLPVLRTLYPQDTIAYFQSNSEGELVSAIQQAQEQDGVVVNAGAYSHTSLALADAVRAIAVPVVEVHITNVFRREKYRHKSFLSAAAQGLICGFGIEGYRLAIEALHGIARSTP